VCLCVCVCVFLCADTYMHEREEQEDTHNYPGQEHKYNNTVKSLTACSGV